MSTLDDFLSIDDACRLLEMNGVRVEPSKLRVWIFRGKVKSEKRFSARLVPRYEITRIIQEKRGK